MSALIGKIMATFDTKSGKAFALELQEGEIKVGDVIGLYGEKSLSHPLCEAIVTDIWWGGEKVPEIANNSRGFSEHFSTLCLDSGPHVLTAGLKVGPNAKTQALKYGLSEEELY